MPWRRDFPDHAVPKRVLDLVESGLLEDKSAPDDPAPSFIAKLLKGGWLRVWVEHPTPELRRAGPWRYRVEIAKDLSQEGRPLIEGNNLNFIWPTLISNLKILGVKSRWRLMGGGGGDWDYYDVEPTSLHGEN